MTFPRFAYRARQFWNAVLQPEARIQNQALLPVLSPSELLLFRQMQPSEQAHAYQVFRKLSGQGRTERDLLAAALLHDVGKILSPLSVIDRVVIVLARYLFPRASRRWGEGTPQGWKRPFVVKACHAQWGADLVQKAGASELTTELVRLHHDPSGGPLEPALEQMLRDLHAADEEY